MTRHLNNSDMASAWCGARPWSEDAGLTANIDECDCHACLDSVLALATKALSRKFQLVEGLIATKKNEQLDAKWRK
jgi:hypothetical protein